MLLLFNLETSYVTSEKLAPSPITLCADISKAVELERKLLRAGEKKGLKDVMGRVVADYNKMTSKKHHRIDSGRRSLILNLLLETT